MTSFPRKNLFKGNEYNMCQDTQMVFLWCIDTLSVEIFILIMSFKNMLEKPRMHCYPVFSM